MTFRLPWREALRRFWQGGGSTDGAVPSKVRRSHTRHWQLSGAKRQIARGQLPRSGVEGARESAGDSEMILRETFAPTLESLCEKPGDRTRMVNGRLLQWRSSVQILRVKIRSPADQQFGDCVSIAVRCRMQWSRAPVTVLVVIIDVCTRLQEKTDGLDVSMPRGAMKQSRTILVACLQQRTVSFDEVADGRSVALFGCFERSLRFVVVHRR
jgi:hypothetical protein